jgi:hypothetical protein
MEDTGATVRFCVILITMGVASAIPILIFLLAHAYLA